MKIKDGSIRNVYMSASTRIYIELHTLYRLPFMRVEENETLPNLFHNILVKLLSVSTPYTMLHTIIIAV